jgi:hypothetical protein
MPFPENRQRQPSFLELPVLVNRLDSPIELFAKCLREETLNRHIELLGEDNSKARINVVLVEVSADTYNSEGAY